MSNLSDLQIINEIKKDNNVESNLANLVDRHSGIYLDMVNAYSSNDNPYIDRNELIKDKEYKIYLAALNFDENRGAKFSTYLGNETKWSCLNSYNKNKRKPVFNSEYIENMSDNPNLNEENMAESLKRDTFNKVLSIIKKHPDKRVEKIFNMRYIIGTKNKVMAWKDIGDKMKLSIQGCINIHNSAVVHVREELKGELSFE
jgi:DNA-directed RNA polymerase sigma subunit (sigma70/sigma32)